MSNAFLILICTTILLSCEPFAWAQTCSACSGGGECSDGSTPTCTSNGLTCSDGASFCLAPPPSWTQQECKYGVSCTAAGWACNGAPGSSPIVIDTTGKGFHLTDVAHGVKFQFFPNKPPVQISWTDPTFANGWLVLDRNHNGKIDNATEMFGNLTSQPSSNDPNGYKALAIFDKKENGGNENGQIDPGDSVYFALRVWVDKNQNGISEPDELHSLPELGIRSLDLRYRESPYVDQYGNAFHYKSWLSFDQSEKDMPGTTKEDFRSFDVFLQMTQSDSDSSSASVLERAGSVHTQKPSEGAISDSYKTADTGPMTPFAVINKLSSAGIVVLTSTSPQFENHLAKLLSPAAIAKAEPLLNKSVIIINAGTAPLLGFTLIYRYPKKLALAGTPWEQRIRRYAASSDSGSLFEPGDEFLFTPVASFEARLNQAGTIHSQPWLDEGTDRMIKVYLNSWIDEETELSVDAIVSETGAVLGDDTADTFGWITAQIQAETELQSAFKLSGDALRKKLLSMTPAQGNDNYARALDITARSILGELDARGEESVRSEMALRATALPFMKLKTSLRRVQ